MSTIRKMMAGLGLAAALTSGVAQAALIDRGGGMIYDTDLNLTWLQDANYAKTSGYDADGLMNWGAAMAWANQLVYGGYSDWRLPIMTMTNPNDPNAGCNFGYSGTNCGYNVDPTTSELAHLFFVELGNKSYRKPDQTLAGCPAADPYCLENVGPFLNAQSNVYWSGSAYAPYPQLYVWYFFTNYGYQYFGPPQGYDFYAWAVRDGDVATAPTDNPVPEPGSLMLVGLALAGLGVARRRGRFGA